jgi:hypothetical protein
VQREYKAYKSIVEGIKAGKLKEPFLKEDFERECLDSVDSVDSVMESVMFPYGSTAKGILEVQADSLK